jgi:single-strand DNA-binding protein
MNNVSLIGNLTREPELRSTKGGAVCQLRVAVDNPGRGGEPGKPTYVDVATFGKHAEACAAHLGKGRQVAVSGRLVFREWTGKDGRKRSAHSVRGSVQFLGSKAEAGSAGRVEPEEVALAF